MSRWIVTRGWLEEDIRIIDGATLPRGWQGQMLQHQWAVLSQAGVAVSRMASHKYIFPRGGRQLKIHEMGKRQRPSHRRMAAGGDDSHSRSPSILTWYKVWYTRNWSWGTVQTTSSTVVSPTPHRLTQVGLFRAFNLPGFFRSTRLISDVTQPARRRAGLRAGSCTSNALARASVIDSA